MLNFFGINTRDELGVVFSGSGDLGLTTTTHEILHFFQVVVTHRLTQHTIYMTPNPATGAFEHTPHWVIAMMFVGAALLATDALEGPSSLSSFADAFLPVCDVFFRQFSSDDRSLTASRWQSRRRIRFHSIDGVPPHVCASLNDRQVTDGAVQAMLLAVLANMEAHLVLEVDVDHVFRGVQVRDIRRRQCVAERGPHIVADLVVLADVEAPNHLALEERD